VVLGCSAILDQDGLDGGEADRAGVIHGSVDIADRKRGAESSESQGVFLGKGRVNDHTFRAAIEKGVSTDFLTRLLSNQEDSESDRRRPYISYGSFRYRIRVKSV
jgi:hypothetical protein